MAQTTLPKATVRGNEQFLASELTNRRPNMNSDLDKTKVLPATYTSTTFPLEPDDRVIIKPSNSTITAVTIAPSATPVVQLLVGVNKSSTAFTVGGVSVPANGAKLMLRVDNTVQSV